MQLVGVDIVEIGRIEKAIASQGARFLKRVYTATEIKLYRNRLPSLAARFSAKEAVIKALGSPGLSLKDIEILSDPDGKPVVRLHGQAKERADSLGVKGLEVSLSHSRDYAVACAVGLTQTAPQG